VIRYRLFPLFGLLALLPACSGADVVNALVPSGGYRVIADRAYGPDPRQRLDLYVPDGAGDGTPLLVFFYGGGWESGAREDYLFVGQAFASRGYIVAIPDYRLYPQIRYPVFIEDAAAAFAWLRREADAATGVGAGPVYLAGHSAGAYIAAMLALDRRWLAAEGFAACDSISAVAGLAGPYDFLPLTGRTLKAIFGDPAPPATQPVNRVDGRAPPLLLIAGTDDTTVLPRNTLALAAAIRAAGGAAQDIVYPDIGHVALAASLASPLRSLAPTLDDVDGFLRRHPKPTGCLAGAPG